MGKSLTIKKIKSENNIHYYLVLDISSDTEFYIGIDPQKNCIYIYKTNTLSNAIDTIYFNSNKNIEIPGIKTSFICYALLKANKAIKRNNFPDDISYCA